MNEPKSEAVVKKKKKKCQNYLDGSCNFLAEKKEKEKTDEAEAEAEEEVARRWWTNIDMKTTERAERTAKAGTAADVFSAVVEIDVRLFTEDTLTETQFSSVLSFS